MAATATKASPKSTTKHTAADSAAASLKLLELIEPFGWSIDPDVDQLPPSVETWLLSAGLEACPQSLMQCVYIPSKNYLQGFRNANDAKAAAYVCLDSKADFNAIKNDPAAAAARIKQRCHKGQQTPFGTVFTDSELGFRVWFGRKAGQLPTLEGQEGVDAMARLFNVADSLRRVEREVSPPVEPTPAAKNKRTKMVAKKADSSEQPEETRSVRGANNDSRLQVVPLRLIQPAKENHRKTFDKDELHELAKSIEAHGVLQPLLLRPLQDGSNFMVIIAGERRYRAALQAGLKEVPAQIVEREGVSESLAMLHENIMRVDLNPIERAQAIRRLMDEHSLSQKEVGQMVGCQQGQISNELRLLNLPESLQALVASGEIAPTLIRVVLPYCDLTDVMTDLAKTIATQFKENAERVFEARDLENWLKTAIMNHSRPMKHSNWSEWSNPSPKERHFSKVSDSDLKELAPRKIDLLNEWEGKERTFNVKKFGELNAKPLASRREKHRLYKEQRGQSSGQKEKTSTAAKPFEREWMVEEAVDSSLAPLLADVIESCKDSQKVRTVCLTLLVLAEGGLEEAFAGKAGNKWQNVSVVPDLLTALDVPQKEADKLLRTTLCAELRRGYRLQTKESIQIGKYVGVDLLQLWKPTDELLKSLTDHGRELLAAAAGSVPEFLLPFFGVEPKKPSKAKKGKAA